MNLVIVVTADKIKKYRKNIIAIANLIGSVNIVLIGDSKAHVVYGGCDVFVEYGIKFIEVYCPDNNKLLCKSISRFAQLCEEEYFIIWDIEVVPTSNMQFFNMSQPYLDIFCDEIAKHIVVKTEIINSIFLNYECDDSEVYPLYIDYIFNKSPELYVCREWKIFADAGKFYDVLKLTTKDLSWLSKDYDGLFFNCEDKVLPEFSYFFHNEEYINKLLPSQVYEAIMQESSLGDEEGGSEYVYSSIIENELNKGKKIAICPYGNEGKKFKNVLNNKYGINEAYIIDDSKMGEVVDDGIRIIGTSDINDCMQDVVVIVNDSDYENNLNIVLKLHNQNRNTRIVSIYGYLEMIIPSRKGFINEVRRLTEVKKVITDRGFVRIGAKNDGGYIMLDDMTSSMPAYSFGINDDVSWDKQIANDYGMNIFMYDHTIDKLPENNPHFNYFHKGISGVDKKDDKLFSLSTLLGENGHLGCTDLLLKMDVEGAEWDVINCTSSEVLSKFRQIVFEFHNLEHPEIEKDILNALKKLNETHFPVWVHGNNHSSAICIDDIVLPTALEILYLNKSYYSYEEKEVFFPWKIDTPNTVLFQDYVLGNWGKRMVDVQSITKSEVYEEVKNKLLQDESFITELKDNMLLHYSIFGPKNRIHLSNTSVMQNALINTMSGEVYVGEDTFCGHNVSIITGSHDASKLREHRKEFPKSGNDIEIGSGVWLCTNTTILGPCKIGDNSVIAAGSVVLPNTEIGEGELWAGVPAKCRKKIDCINL